MSEPKLLPDETVILTTRPDPTHLRGRWLVMVGLFAVIFMIVTQFVDGVGRGGWLLAVAAYAALTALLVLGIEARRRWTLTDRRLIPPAGAPLIRPLRLEADWRGQWAVDGTGQRVLMRDIARDGDLVRAIEEAG